MGINEDHVGTPSQGLTDKAFELQKAGAIAARIVTDATPRFVASGECPGCGGHFSIDRASEIVAVKSEGLPQVEVVICNAPVANGTPEGKVGCGACFSVYAPEAPSPVGGK